LEEYLAMPMMWLKAHAEALAELQGEECFREAEVISVGAGKLSKRDHGKVINRWNAAIGRDTSTRIKGAGDLSRLQAYGIKVREDGAVIR
jgi:hypothetical protein